MTLLLHLLAVHVKILWAGGEELLTNRWGPMRKPKQRKPNDQHYFAAFLRDPDNNKIEIVTFAGE
jgi:catechol 2,3-dioxygenase-like lactoylglutathione lyase family enzyme